MYDFNRFKVDGWVFEEKIPRDILAECYRVSRPDDQRSYLGVILPPDDTSTRARSDRLVDRFRHEGALQHSRLLPVHACDRFLYMVDRSHRVYVITEWFEPEHLLDAREADRRESPATVLRLLVEGADLLTGLARANWRHGNVDPDTILWAGDGGFLFLHPLLAQLLALHQAVRSTNTGCWDFTFVAPEEAGGRSNGTIASDVFALCAIAYHCLTGTKPYDASSLFLLDDSLLANAHPRDPRKLVGELDPRFALVLGCGLAIDCAQRYAHPQQLAMDLKALASGQGPPYAERVTAGQALWAETQPANTAPPPPPQLDLQPPAPRPPTAASRPTGTPAPGSSQRRRPTGTPARARGSSGRLPARGSGGGQARPEGNGLQRGGSDRRTRGSGNDRRARASTSDRRARSAASDPRTRAAAVSGQRARSLTATDSNRGMFIGILVALGLLGIAAAIFGTRSTGLLPAPRPPAQKQRPTPPTPRQPDDAQRSPQRRSGETARSAPTLPASPLRPVPLDRLPADQREPRRTPPPSPATPSAQVAPKPPAVDLLAAAVPPDPLQPGLIRAEYHGRWRTLPDFTELVPEHTSTATAIGLDTSTRTDHFALRFSGFIDVPIDGHYRFTLTSDDGSRLSIGGRLVVDNDGAHSKTSKTGTIALGAGLHPIVIDYFEFEGNNYLHLAWTPPQARSTAIPTARLFHVRKTSAAPEAATLPSPQRMSSRSP
ncbi:MAG: PA14 domain-containing protein [Planctomycetota bacterium]